MKLRNLLLALTAIAILCAPLLAGAKGKKNERSFDVCVDATMDFSFLGHDTDDPNEFPTAGDKFTGVGAIYEGGKGPEGASLFSDCSLGTGPRIGTFYTNGHFQGTSICGRI